uniref:Ig-like domain-containing protein n=1 Tax=Strigamia maritima TaxID=126957 RepID=T1IZV8_STRMM
IENCAQKESSFIFSFFTFIFVALATDPEFSEQIPNMTVAVGRDATLPCVVDHLGSHKVAWIHVDKQMILTIHHHVITRNPRFRLTHNNPKHWILHITNVQEEDRGYYMCQINTVPMKSQIGHLDVVVSPDILDEESSPSNVVVKETFNVTLVCKASGYPAPKITWRREDNQAIMLGKRTGQQESIPIVEGPELTIPKVSRIHMGAYLCIASNGVPPSVSKRILLDVEFSPMIWIPNQLVGAPIKNDVILECYTEAHPKSINYWSRSQGVIISNNKYEISEIESAYKVQMKLKIRKLDHKDYGPYKCAARNSLGGTEGSIRLYEIHPPTQSPRITDFKITKQFEEITIRNDSASARSNIGFQRNALLEEEKDVRKASKKHSKEINGNVNEERNFEPPKKHPTPATGTAASSRHQWLALCLSALILTSINSNHVFGS